MCLHMWLDQYYVSTYVIGAVLCVNVIGLVSHVYMLSEQYYVCKFVVYVGAF